MLCPWFYIKTAPLICFLPFYNARKHCFYQTKVYTTFCVVTFVIFVSSSSYLTMTREGASDYNGIILQILIVYNYITDIWLILGPSTWNFVNLVTFFDSVTKLDAILYTKDTKTNKTKNGTFIFCFAAVVMTSVTCYEYSIWHYYSTLGQQMYFVCDTMKCYYVLYLTCLLKIFLGEIQVRFVDVNNLFENLKQTKQSHIVVYSRKQDGDTISKLKKIKTIQMAFVTAMMASRHFEQAFGMHLFVLMMHIMLYIFVYLYMILVDNFVTTLTDILITAFWITFTIAHGVAIASKCEQVQNEGRKTVALAYKMVNRFASVPVLSDAMFALAQQTTATHSNISAAGLFNVDHTMLFMFVNLIATYIIVIIQFAGTASATPSRIFNETMS